MFSVAYILVISFGFAIGACFRIVQDPEKSAPIVRWSLFFICHALTKLWQLGRWLFAFVAADRDRAPRRLSEGPRFLSIGPTGQLVGLNKLPRVPRLPPIETLEFAGCANLCAYTAGAAYAMQKSPNYEEQMRQGRMRARGASSGAFVATAFAAGCNMAEFMRLMHREFTLHSRRVGGCIGMYSRAVGTILSNALRQAQEPLAKGKVDLGLEISVTRFAPWPEHVVVSTFDDEQMLIDTVLASCYIPVAYEKPKRLSEIGFCIDGCAAHFMPNAQYVASPYHCHNAEIMPEHEYPRQMVFNLLHGDDVLRLFEDGFLDTIHWLDQGAPSKLFDRMESTGEPGASTATLINEAKRLAWELFSPFGKRKSD